jgi:hypothetical protein
MFFPNVFTKTPEASATHSGGDRAIPRLSHCRSRKKKKASSPGSASGGEMISLDAAARTPSLPIEIVTSSGCRDRFLCRCTSFLPPLVSPRYAFFSVPTPVTTVVILWSRPTESSPRRTPPRLARHRQVDVRAATFVAISPF